MMHEPFSHLTSDDLDSWLAGRLDANRTSHLETCEECREVVEAEGELVRQLSSLPMVAPSSALADHVMARVVAARPALVEAARHVTADEIDALLDGQLEPARLWHIEDCAECFTFALEERALVERLAAMPLFAPAADFPVRVLAGVNAPAPAAAWAAGWRDRVPGSRKSIALAAGIALAVAGSMAGSVVWSLSHQEALTAAGTWLSSQAGQLMWIGLRGAASNLLEQPWYSSLRHLVGSPGLLAACSALASATYVGCALALRRLLTVPVTQVARAAA